MLQCLLMFRACIRVIPVFSTAYESATPTAVFCLKTCEINRKIFLARHSLEISWMDVKSVRQMHVCRYEVVSS